MTPLDLSEIVEEGALRRRPAKVRALGIPGDFEVGSPGSRYQVSSWPSGRFSLMLTAVYAIDLRVSPTSSTS